jgi:NAD(P)-dependent dehydrogenase (short-subunit alcohol dehydrogenase family)
MDGKLAGKVAIVTGGGSGIGRGVALRFAQEGANVAVMDMNADGAGETADLVRREGPDAMVLTGDVTDSSAVDEAVAKASERFGRLDIMMANAGIGDLMPVLTTSDAQWRRLIEVDLTGVFFSIRAAARQMIAEGHGGSILSTSSANARLPAFGMSSYCAAKAGVVKLTECAAIELADKGIRVNTIGPGPIRTPLTAAIDEIPEIYDAMMDFLAIKRMGEPADVGAMAAFLASDDASYVTGQAFYVDGGMTILGYPNMRPFAEANPEGLTGSVKVD